MSKISVLRRVVALALAGTAAGGGPAQADPSGLWKRPNGETVEVSSSGGRLMCRISKGRKAGFEMCNGMGGIGRAWRGSEMKHPDMPAFMSFNGTVAVAGNTLSIKGCAVGQSMCDSETWTRVK